MAREAQLTLLAAAVVVIAAYFWARSAMAIGLVIGLGLAAAFYSESTSLRARGFGDGPSGTVRMPAAFMALATAIAGVVVVLGAVGRPVETPIALLPFIFVFALAPRVLTRDPAPPGPGDGPQSSDYARWRPRSGG